MAFSTPTATFFFRGSGISTRSTAEKVVDPLLAARREQIGREIHIWGPILGFLILTLILLSVFDRD